MSEIGRIVRLLCLLVSLFIVGAACSSSPESSPATDALTSTASANNEPSAQPEATTLSVTEPPATAGPTPTQLPTHTPQPDPSKLLCNPRGPTTSSPGGPFTATDDTFVSWRLIISVDSYEGVPCIKAIKRVSLWQVGATRGSNVALLATTDLPVEGCRIKLSGSAGSISVTETEIQFDPGTYLACDDPGLIDAIKDTAAAVNIVMTNQDQGLLLSDAVLVRASVRFESPTPQALDPMQSFLRLFSYPQRDNSFDFGIVSLSASENFQLGWTIEGPLTKADPNATVTPRATYTVPPQLGDVLREGAFGNLNHTHLLTMQLVPLFTHLGGADHSYRWDASVGPFLIQSIGDGDGEMLFPFLASAPGAFEFEFGNFNSNATLYLERLEFDPNDSCYSCSN